MPLGAYGRAERVSYVPDDILHSFTSVFRVRPASPGLAAAVRSAGDGTARIFITKEGGIEFRSASGAAFTAQASLLDGRRFFIRSVGPEIEILFPSKEGGRPDRLLFKMGGQEMTGKRKPAGLG